MLEKDGAHLRPGKLVYERGVCGVDVVGRVDVIALAGDDGIEADDEESTMPGVPVAGAWSIQSGYVWNFSLRFQTKPLLGKVSILSWSLWSGLDRSLPPVMRFLMTGDSSSLFSWHSSHTMRLPPTRMWDDLRNSYGD